MPELREVFDMVAQQAEPSLDSWTRQEQRQRRSSRNRRVGGIAVAAAIAILAGMLIARALPGRGGQPAAPRVEDGSAPPVGTGPAPTGLTTDVALATFTSTQYRYSIGYPGGWAVQPATEMLHDLGIPKPSSSGVDSFSPSAEADDQLLIVGAQRLERGTTLEEWTSQVQGFVDACLAPESQEAVRIDGERANVAFLPACDFVFEFHIWATFVHGRMGYHVIWIGRTGDETRDRAIFDRVLQSFRFTD